MILRKRGLRFYGVRKKLKKIKVLSFFSRIILVKEEKRGSVSFMSDVLRKRTEQAEDYLLCEYAKKSADSEGRAVFEQPDPIRTCFQRDRDRIIHCNAFRRLKYKTQVFLDPERDHYRTRLTHTLEVSQIARTISRALRLNEDLTEAIAIGHDLGHTPFGHAGERALNEICPLGFRHNEQSVRVVDRLEKNGNGLNLTYEVKDGIFNHTSGVASTLEGRVVRVSDRIAYINHDIDDAVRADVLKESDIPSDIVKNIGNRRSVRINTLVNAVIEGSMGKNDIVVHPSVNDYFDRLHEFMFESVYRNPVAKSQEGKAAFLVKTLYEYFCEHTDMLSDECKMVLEKEGTERAVCDYIAGMTDRYAIRVYEDLFIPYSWK